MDQTPITLEAIGLQSWNDLYSIDPADVIRLMGEKNVPVHAGDAFLTVLVVRAVADLAAASKRLERLTIALAAVALLTLLVAVVALVS